VALATLATITAKGGIATATAATMIAASEEYRSITAQESTNRPMQAAISPKYQRLSARDGCGPGSLPVTSVRCPGQPPAKRRQPAVGRRVVRARGHLTGYVHMHVRRKRGP
jgi:hypothetical protein